MQPQDTEALGHSSVLHPILMPCSG